MANPATKSTFDLRNKVKKMSTRGRLTGYTRFLLLELALVQGKNDTSWCSNETLRQTLGAGKNEIKICMDRLIKLGLITQAQRGGRIRTTVVDSRIDDWIAEDSRRETSQDESGDGNPDSVEDVGREEGDSQVNHAAPFTLWVESVEQIAPGAIDGIPQTLDEGIPEQGEHDDREAQDSKDVPLACAPATIPTSTWTGIPSTRDSTAHESLQLATMIFNYAGRRGHHNNAEHLAADAKELDELIKVHTFPVVGDVMCWAFTVSSFWPEHLVGAPDPVKYFRFKFQEKILPSFLREKAAGANAAKAANAQPHHSGGTNGTSTPRSKNGYSESGNDAVVAELLRRIDDSASAAA